MIRTTCVSRSMVTLLVLLGIMTMAIVLSGCGPQATHESAVVESNDTVTRGEYEAYEPAAETEATSGSAIEGSEEEQLQQERIAGGAVGGVMSKNLEPLEGIVNEDDSEYVPTYGDETQPPVMGHKLTSNDCMNCHDGADATVQMPSSHTQANLVNEDCGSCHQEP